MGNFFKDPIDNIDFNKGYLMYFEQNKYLIILFGILIFQENINAMLAGRKVHGKVATPMVVRVDAPTPQQQEKIAEQTRKELEQETAKKVEEAQREAQEKVRNEQQIEELVRLGGGARADLEKMSFEQRMQLLEQTHRKKQEEELQKKEHEIHQQYQQKEKSQLIRSIMSLNPSITQQTLEKLTLTQLAAEEETLVRQKLLEEQEEMWRFLQAQEHYHRGAGGRIKEAREILNQYKDTDFSTLEIPFLIPLKGWADTLQALSTEALDIQLTKKIVDKIEAIIQTALTTVKTISEKEAGKLGYQDIKTFNKFEDLIQALGSIQDKQAVAAARAKAEIEKLEGQFKIGEEEAKKPQPTPQAQPGGPPPPPGQKPGGPPPPPPPPMPKKPMGQAGPIERNPTLEDISAILDNSCEAFCLRGTLNLDTQKYEAKQKELGKPVKIFLLTKLATTLFTKYFSQDTSRFNEIVKSFADMDNYEKFRQELLANTYSIIEELFELLIQEGNFTNSDPSNLEKIKNSIQNVVLSKFVEIKKALTKTTPPSPEDFEKKYQIF